MINLQNSMLLLRKNSFPWNSKIKLTLTEKLIVKDQKPESIISKDMLNLIRGLCCGLKTKNPIEEIVDFSSDAAVLDFFYNNSKFHTQALDINSDIATVTIDIEILFANSSQITDSILEKIDKLEIKTFLGSFRLK